jgi:hypothetical protein
MKQGRIKYNLSVCENTHRKTSSLNCKHFTIVNYVSRSPIYERSAVACTKHVTIVIYSFSSSDFDCSCDYKGHAENSSVIMTLEAWVNYVFITCHFGLKYKTCYGRNLRIFVMC